MTATVSAMPIRENAFRDAVKEYAERRSWLVYFTWRSIHSPAGFPDLVAIRHGRLVVAELKIGKNKPTADQERWLAAFRDLDADVGVHVWYPEDWPTIEEVLG